MRKNKSYSAKQEIKNAVIRLMAQKSYMDVTVTDIVNDAGVARASLYRNFHSINDVLNEIADEASDELIEDVFDDYNERKCRELLFNHFYRLKKRHDQMRKVRLNNFSVIRTRINDGIRKESSTFFEGTKKDKYLIIGKMGLMYSIEKGWIDTGMEETPEEMIDLIMSAITAF